MFIQGLKAIFKLNTLTTKTTLQGKL